MPRGGYRPGAGRPKKGEERPDVEALAVRTDDPVAFLTAVMNDVSQEVRVRADAAKALLPYKHKRLGEGGKKEQRQEVADRVAAGRFAPSQPPRLVVNNKG